MKDERALLAIARIERALARIDGAAARLPAKHDDTELETLRSAHSKLRGRVETAIAQIDDLLAARSEA